jgi:hypothetical protein
VLHSIHNDGKGIKVSLCFIPLLPATKPGHKRRKNAKAKPENRLFYMHEDSTLAELIDAAIKALDKVDYLGFTIGNRSGVLAPDNFSVKYSINRTSSKDIPLVGEAHFRELVDEVTKMKSPTLKLEITEEKVLNYNTTHVLVPHISTEAL